MTRTLTFVVVAMLAAVPAYAQGGGKGKLVKQFKALDANKDNMLTETEVGNEKWQDLADADTNKDQAVSLKEYLAHHGKGNDD